MVRTSGCVGPRTRRIFSAAGPGEGFPRRREFKSSVMTAFGACLLLSGLPAAAAEGASSEAEGEGGDRAENSFPVQGEVPQLIPRGAARSDLSGSSGPGLDALLQLPNSFRSRETPSVAGANEADWRRRFVNSELELSSAREELDRSKRELVAVAEGGAASNAEYEIDLAAALAQVEAGLPLDPSKCIMPPADQDHAAAIPSDAYAYHTNALTPAETTALITHTPASVSKQIMNTHIHLPP